MEDAYLALEVSIANTHNFAHVLRFGVVSAADTRGDSGKSSRGVTLTQSTVCLWISITGACTNCSTVCCCTRSTLLSDSDLFLTDISVGDRMWADAGGGLASPDPFLGVSRIQVLLSWQSYALCAELYTAIYIAPSIASLAGILQRI